MADNLSSKLASFNQGVKSTGEVVGATSTLVATKAKDTLVTVDGYGKSAVSTLTNMTNSIKNRIADAKNFLFNSPIGDLGSLNDALASAKAIKEDVNALTQQLSDSIDQTISTVKGISEDILNSANAELNFLNQIPYDQMTSPSGAFRVIMGATAPEVNNLIESANRLIDLPGETLSRVTDKYSDIALRVSLIKNAGALGLMDVIDRVMQSDPNNIVYKVALIDQFDTAVMNGELTIINKMIDTLGVEFVLGRYPNAVGDILENFRFPLGLMAVDYPACKDDLLATLVKLNVNWDMSNSSHLKYRNLSVFSNASDATIKVLSTEPLYNRMMKVAAHFSTATPLKVLAKSQYPYSAIS